MSLEKYKELGLLFNSNFLEETSTSGLQGYRGELVLIEGEIGDSKGHSKPPVEVMRGAVMLSHEKIKLLIGALDQLESLTTLSEKYKADFAEDMLSVLFVVDIKEPVQVDVDGQNFVLIPLVQGVPWNEIIDELALEKSDFKGQSPADKIVTLYEELKSYSPKYPTVSLDEALAATTDRVRESYGAV
ncbi:MAG: hypothetical protein P8Y24_06465 [Gammaproteobacteria bacterium]